MKKYTLLYIIVLCAAAIATGALTSCKKTVSMTTVAVKDSVRHYYPLVQGTDLTLVYDVTNTGSSPLVITDVQPSCGCIEMEKEEEYVVIPGKAAHLTFVFHSAKNCGYVKHTIRLYGNMKPSGMACLVFDTNVIPPADVTPDYEELYKDQQSRQISEEGTLDEGSTDGGGDDDQRKMLQDELKRGYWTGKKP